MEPFYDIVSTELSPFEMDIKVCDYVLNGNWDFRIFQGIILEDIMICIRAAKPPLASYGDDTLSWEDIEVGFSLLSQRTR